MTWPPAPLAPRCALTLYLAAGLLAVYPANALAADEVHRLDDVVVTGTRTARRLADAPVATEVISRSEIEASGARDAAQLLSGRTGIDIVPSLGVQAVRLQGLEPEHVLIFVDGKRVTGRVNGAVDLSRFPTETLERVEIVRGASSALYGSEAMGGVIHLFTRPAKKPLAFEGQAAYGTMGSGLLDGSVEWVNGNLSSRLSAGWHRRDAFDLKPETLATDGNAFDQLDLADRSEFRLSDAVTLKGQFDYLYRNQHGIDANSAGAVFDRRNLTETFSAAFGPEFRLSDQAKLSLSGYYNLYRDQFLQDQRGSDALDQAQQTRDHLLQFNVQHEHTFSLSQLLTSGGEVAYERLETERLANGASDRVRAALYLQDEWQALDLPRIIVVPGLRADTDSRFGTHFAPKLAVRLDPTETTTLRASLGSGFRAPDFKELSLRFQNPAVGYQVVGNPALRPETSRSLNLGFEAWPTRWVWLGLNLYHNDVDDLIQTQLRAPSGAGAMTEYQYVNVASAVTRGLEASLRLQPLQGLILEPGYTFTDTLDKQHNRPLSGRAPHTGSLAARYQHDASGFGGYAKASLVGNRFYYQDRNGNELATPIQLPAYTTLDVKLTKSLNHQVSAFLQGDNLLNAGDPTYLAIQPRTILAGLTTRL